MPEATSEAMSEGLTVEVPLAHARWRKATWALAYLGLGAFAVAKLGSLGQAIGVLLLLGGALEARSFVRTLVSPVGAIVIRDQDISLPTRPCAGAILTVPIGDLRHAYFLRRAVPWTTTGPVLVVETEHRTFAYPRDWFTSELDQREIATALNRRLGRL